MNEISGKEIPGPSAWDNPMHTQHDLNTSMLGSPKIPNEINLMTSPNAPCTPQGPPAVSVFNDDLHPELVHQGWRKFWSKRENRPYFWNKLTGESLWETPLIKAQFDPITDPLGICHAGPQPVTTSPMGLKRRASEDGGPIAKKFILPGPWDLEIPTNVIIYERAPTIAPHPHPEIEGYRCGLTSKLRQCYQELCQSREGRKKESSFLHSYPSFCFIMKKKLIFLLVALSIKLYSQMCFLYVYFNLLVVFIFLYNFFITSE